MLNRCFVIFKTSTMPAERDVKPAVTRHQTSCPDFPTNHHMIIPMPPHRKSVTANPVSTMDYSIVNDDFSKGPKGAQRIPVLLTASRELYII